VSVAEVPFLEQARDRIEGGAAAVVLLIECGVIDRVDALWGYQVGDALRGRAAALLREELLRPGDLLGEMGRDDIACVLGGISDPAMAELAAEKSLRALQAPFFAGDDEVFASPAIGIALCPTHGSDAGVLLQRAKSACETARRDARRIKTYDEQGTNLDASTLLQDSRLRTAVVDDSLEMVFQPQYDLRLGQIMGAEALLRWPGSATGIVPAGEAFAAAEAAGVVTGLVSSILNRALRNTSDFRYSAGLDLRISIKLPARALRNTELPDVVQAALGTWRLRAGRLNLEIGETGLLRSEPATRETLERLKALGTKLSIDDPGMPLSSLFEFTKLPFQEIRIDVSQAGDLAAASKSESILRSIVDLAHQLKLEVVAVGAADDPAVERLKELGCDYLQADYKGAAVDPTEFVTRFGFAD
jgi:predicted signal transduction protein with EAL and GGDEF domain